MQGTEKPIKVDGRGEVFESVDAIIRDRAELLGLLRDAIGALDVMASELDEEADGWAKERHPVEHNYRGLAGEIRDVVAKLRPRQVEMSTG